MRNQAVHRLVGRWPAIYIIAKEDERWRGRRMFIEIFIDEGEELVQEIEAPVDVAYRVDAYACRHLGWSPSNHQSICCWQGIPHPRRLILSARVFPPFIAPRSRRSTRQPVVLQNNRIHRKKG